MPVRSAELKPGDVFLGTGDKRCRTVQWQRDGIVLAQNGQLWDLRGCAVSLAARPSYGTVTVMPESSGWRWSCSCRTQGPWYADERLCRDEGARHQEEHD